MGQARWEHLFEDLEAQLAAQERLDTEAETAERTRRERALVSWIDRLAAHEGSVTVAASGGQRITGRVSDIGTDWVLLETTDGGEMLIPLSAVRTVEGLRARARPGGSARRFGLGSALRVLARDRAVVEIVDREGGRHTGTIDVVLADAAEVALHHADEPRRAGNVQARVLIPYAALAAVRRLR